MWLGTHLQGGQKEILSKELVNYFDTIDELKCIYQVLGSESTLNILIGHYNGRLNNINNKLYGELRKVR